MNYRGHYNRMPLEECPKCGMDSGKRMVTTDVPELFYVVCELCKYKTKAHKTQSHATREWNGGK